MSVREISSNGLNCLCPTHVGHPEVHQGHVRQMLAITSAKFGANSDFTSIAKVVEEWAGVEIKG